MGGSTLKERTTSAAGRGGRQAGRQAIGHGQAHGESIKYIADRLAGRQAAGI